jgi:hypothetical protein
VPKKPGETSISGRVAGMLIDNKNVPLKVEDIAQRKGLEKRQVQLAISKMRRESRMDIEAVVAGHVFVYRGMFAEGDSGGARAARANMRAAEFDRGEAGTLPVAEDAMAQGSTVDIFTLLGKAKDGSLVLENGQGRLYRAVEL